MRNSTRLFLAVALVALAGCSTGVSDDPTAPTETLASPDAALDTDFEPAGRVAARVTAVVDGDTIDVRLANGTTETIRLLGIDTPEVHVENEPAEFEGVPDTDAGRTCLRNAGEQASARVESRLAGENVTLLFDSVSDRRGGYGRLLAYVSHRGTNVNAALVADGSARVYDAAFALRAQFEDAESRARADGNGLWRCQSPA